MDLLVNTAVIAAVFGALIAALFTTICTEHQVRVSNKQFFFDRRLDALLFVKELHHLYMGQKRWIDELTKDRFLSFTQILFANMTNCVQLESLQKVVPVYGEGIDVRQRDYLVLLATIRQQIASIEFFFPGDMGCKAAHFAWLYMEYVEKLRRQMLYAANVEETAEERRPGTDKQKQEVMEGKMEDLESSFVRPELESIAKQLDAASKELTPKVFRKLTKKASFSIFHTPEIQRYE